MASPLTPRTVHPSALPGEPRAAGPVRPSPQRSLVDRVLERLEPHLPAGLRVGDPLTHRAAEGLPDDIDTDADEPFGPPPAGCRSRLVARVLVVAVTAAVAWWLLRPPPAPVEAVLPLAGEVPAAQGANSASGSVDPADPGAASSSAGESNPGAAPQPGVGVTPPPADDGDPAETANALVVQAAGAVVHPGVYRLPGGARVDDLVRAAGGVRLDADLDRVNLAAPVHDGERVWVPRVGEEVAPPVVAGGGAPPAPPVAGGGGSTGSSGEAGALVDLNTATAEELETLPGIGPVTAGAIVAHREANGPFGSVDALLDVRGIGEAKLEQVRPLVRV